MRRHQCGHGASITATGVDFAIGDLIGDLSYACVVDVDQEGSRRARALTPRLSSGVWGWLSELSDDATLSAWR